MCKENFKRDDCCIHGSNCINECISSLNSDHPKVYVDFASQHKIPNEKESWDTSLDAKELPEEMLDPWMHRSVNMKCQSCMWHCPKDDTSVGRCRRHAPTMNGYPVVFITDWCGDHKLNERSL